MKVLIIGSKGMLGQELVRVFHDADMIAWDRSEIDITNQERVREQVHAAAPALIINAAAYNAVDKAETESELANRVNGDAVGFLAEAAAEIGATFVHYSTDYVFGGAPPPLAPPPNGKGGNEFGYAEDVAPSPQSAYARSKVLGEQRLREVAARYPAWRWYLVRLSRLFGPQGSSSNTKRSFVDTMVSLSATKDRLELIDEEVSSPTYAPDLAVATRDLVLGEATSPPRPPSKQEGGKWGGAAPPGVYHRTNDGSCTWYGFAKEIFRITGWRGTAVPVPASAFPRPAQRPACSVLQTTKLPPMRRWEEALREYLRGMTKSECRMTNQARNPND